jgi:phage/plasmid-like protein (TIGR03299 family)
MSVEQILAEANANWTVSKESLFGPNGEPTQGFGIFRNDTNRCLGIVGSKYHPTQNREIAETLYEAAGQQNLKIARAGMLGNGQKVYFQLGLPDVRIGGSDSKRFLTALTSHDGSAPIGFGTTNVVVVCANTFFSALKDMQRVRHTANSAAKISLISNQLRNSVFQEEALIDVMMQMSKTTIPSTITDEFLLSIIGGDEEFSRTKNRLNNLRTAMTTEYNTHGETAYGLFNAITRYTNHMLTYKDVEAKRNALMSGVAFKTNQRGFDTIYQEFVAPTIDKSYHLVGVEPV